MKCGCDLSVWKYLVFMFLSLQFAYAMMTWLFGFVENTLMYKVHRQEHLNTRTDKMSLDFYCMPGSPPCAVVSLVFSALGIESKVKHHSLDIMAKEHMKPEFLKLNPQHTAPTLVDDGLILSESRSIAKYLVGKYGGNIYPEDLKTRAIIDSRLDFDLGTLYSRFGDYYYAPYFGAPVDEKKFVGLQEALGILNTLLQGKYAVGKQLTLADFCLAVTVSMIEAADISIGKYPNIVKWYMNVKSEIPNYEKIVGKYVQEFKEFFVMLSKK